MVMFLERDADLHMAQLMPLPLTVSAVKSRFVLPFWYRLTWVVPGKRAVKLVCVCVLYVTISAELWWLSGGGILSELLCGVLCTIVVHSNMHTNVTSS